MHRCLAFAAAILLFLGLALSPAQAGPVSLEKKTLWAHAMIVFPLDLDVVKPWVPNGWEQLYPLYPLDTRQSWGATGWHLPDVHSAKAAGIDGFSVDIFADGKSAGGYLDAADKAGNFHVAACLDLGGTKGTEAEKEKLVIQAVSDYCDLAKNHPSAAKVGDAFLIFTYNSIGPLPPDGWARVRAELDRKGYKTWWMPDFDPGDLAGKPVFPAEQLAAYLPMHESGYLFGWAGRYFETTQQMFRRAGKPFAGGMMPGYYRVGGGYDDAKATRTYRERWKRHLRANLDWVSLTTWNDLSENTQLMPNSDWNLTRSELTRWMAARWKGQPAPWKDARLYLTTPKMLYPGREAPVEALVLNGSAQSVRVRVELRDGRGQPLGRPVEATVGARSAGDATVTLKLPQAPGGRWARAVASVRPVGRGGSVQSVRSAPILFPDAEAQPGVQVLYWSVPAHKALTSPVRLSLSGTPSGGRTAQATLRATSPRGAQFAEVLFNAEILKNFLTTPPAPLTVPIRDGGTTTPDGAQVQPDGAIKGGTEWGFYLGRYTDPEYRVGYSDPIYVAPVGDLKVKSRYSFDEGEGSVAADQSPYRRAASLQNVQWVRPGAENSAAAISFNGVDARLNLSLSGTPNGPVRIRFAARPEAYGGMFFADAGGMWMTTTPTGQVQFVRLGGVNPHQWVTATSQATIPLGVWSNLEFTYDGAQIRVFVNGKPDGEAACPNRFSSWRRAVGYNPYGSGSDFYHGDIDDFEIETYSPAP